MVGINREIEIVQLNNNDTETVDTDVEKDLPAIEKSPPGENNQSVNQTLVDPNTVDWDGPSDPANPRNWPHRCKMSNVGLVSLSVLYANISTTMFAPGATDLYAEFNVTNSIVATLAVTIPSLGSSTGPLLFAPMSELFGRLPIYWVSSTLYLGFTIGCARSTNIAMFLVFRFLCGASASSFMTCGGGTIADLLPKEERGAATAMFTAGPLLGPVVGPIIGGFVTQALGWRWTFYLVIIFAFVVTATAMIFMRETNSSIILNKKANRLRKETGNPNLRPARVNPIPPVRLIQRSLIRPLRMLFLSPIIIIIGLYMALVFGITYLLFASFPSVFEETYGWSAGVSGLAYLGLGFGCAVGLSTFAKVSDNMLRKDSRPETRLLLLMWLGPSVPVGIFWYGWSADQGVQWIVPIIGTAFIGLGTMIVTSSCQIYMMDTFGPEAAASALAATTLVRNASGTFLALAADPLYDQFGLGWGNSVLGFIAIAFIPVPFVFYRYGAWLREKFPIEL